ncbi:MAG: dihydropteroate synthase [Lautropia sp.]
MPGGWRCGRFVLSLSRPLVMGVLNVTPDSFSDGGLHADPARAIDAARRMVDEGADIIDIGAESTRPGAEPVSPDREWARLEPVLDGLRDLGRPLSVDTRRAEVMRRALAAGVDIVNDIEGFADPASVAAFAAGGAGAVIMHMRGEPQTMQQDPVYRDVVAQVRQFLGTRAENLIQSGVDASRICVDPGFGFGKTLEHNVALLARLDALAGLGFPVLAGVSRKSMIGQLTGRPPGERLVGSVAAALVAVANGASVVRVHDVASTVDALAVWNAVRRVRG